MYRFDLVIHALPAAVQSGPPLRCGEWEFATLAVDPTRLADPLGVSFEQAGTALEQLPRMFFEPDGYFLWTGPGWQVDGMLFDRNERLLYVEAHGRCPPPQFDQLLTALGWPEPEMLFQLRRHAVFVEEQEFRRWASSCGQERLGKEEGGAR